MSRISPVKKTLRELAPRVIFVRDRKSAGGGIHHYYEAIAPFLEFPHEFIDVGRPHSFYGGTKSFFGRWTLFRITADWLSLVFRIIRFRPDLVFVNPCLDPEEGCRGLKRDAIMLLGARLFKIPVVAFWRGWNNAWCGRPEFPGGNSGWLCRTYKKAVAQIVLASRFKDDLQRWGFTMAIHLESTVAASDCLEGKPVSGSEVVTTNLLYLSRIEVAKGVFELLDAFRILKGLDPAYTLTIAGDGPDLGALREYARVLKLEGVLFPGYVTGPAKQDLYRKASIFCFASYTEGMPNAVLEAMGMGLPIVASDAGGLSDILIDRQTGGMLPMIADGVDKARFDAREIASGIHRIAQDKAGYLEISRNNTAISRERFAPPNVAARIGAIAEATG